jgi:hypothetical protein
MQEAQRTVQAQPKIKPAGRPTLDAPSELEGSGQVEGKAGPLPSGTDLGWLVPTCFGDPRTGFRHDAVGTAPLRQASGATT